MSTLKRQTWKSVRDAIHAKILNATYSPGDKLPKDEDIAKELGCARTTVQRAMRDLSDSGLILRRRKGGTHIRFDPVTKATLHIPVIRTQVEERGDDYGYQLVNRNEAQTPFPVMASFGISAPEHMLHVEALHLANQRPYLYEDRWISTITVPQILEVDLERESANEWLLRNKPYSRCDMRFYAMNATAYLANLLDVKINDALFVTERTTWIDEQPITTLKSIAAPGYQMVARI